MSARAKIEEVEKIHGGLRPAAGRTGKKQFFMNVRGQQYIQLYGETSLQSEL